MNSLGCSFLESGINFDFDMISDCCIAHNDGRGLPILLKNYHGESIDWEKLFDKKAKRIACQKEQTIYECEGCYHLSEFKFSNERKISDFHFSQCHLCNSKCIYCSKEYSENIRNYDVYPVIKDLIEKGYYKSGGEATFQGGEHSSGIKYSQVIEYALKQDKGSVVISLDSATSKTYKNIKQVDCFNKVCETIKNYSKANSDNVIIKYIIIPGENDNILEINKFFKLMKSFGIKTIAMDLEVQYARKYNNKDVSNHIFLLADYFEEQAKKYRFNLLTYSFISYVLKNRKIKKSLLIKNNFLYTLYVCIQNDKKKNIIYRR